jgi:thiamine-monophosphate kinase
MKKIDIVSKIGEIGLIKIIEELVKDRSGQILVRDDAFFFDTIKHDNQEVLVLNSDMFVSTTDAPEQMSYYEMGSKSIIINISDLLVKGVKPEGLIISLGLPEDLLIENFRSIIKGIIDCSSKWNLKYIGGDINETKEIIINPTVFGFKDPSMVIRRSGASIGDLLVVNNRFGLTGVGFDILINKRGKLEEFAKYKRSISSVLNPVVDDVAAFVLANDRLAKCSIDSSDGLSKSIIDLMLSNPNLGFEVVFDENVIDKEALDYSMEFNINLEDLVLNGGEEFIHLFVIDPNKYNSAKILVESVGGKLYKIGKVIEDNAIYLLKEGKTIKFTPQGYEHFT